MILTDDDELCELCLSLRNQGRGRGGGWLAHKRLGYNYRLSDINCVIGLVQLGRIEEFKAKRKKVAGIYEKHLGGYDGVRIAKGPAGCEMSWFVYVVRLTEGGGKQRDEILHEMVKRGIQVSNYFPPVHLQPFMVEKFGFKEGDFPITEKVSKETIALPFHNNLSEEEIGLVCDELKSVIG